ncbi:citrate:proton symporter [Maribacter litopenaei]|uniref:Citrate:proton symporter n=1 Tax=Maribacter litopenaei TaxID=2976127 RepID=A0ABY5Y7X9_9FLAO|nr:citrate:proton symporter [Maribacter litopenaei]UWX55123.1 citrate:proton symporter [Maribacter litopenaei]
MLAWLGLLTIIGLLFLVMSKKMAAVVALIIVPIITALLGGFTTEIITFVTEGLKSIAPTGVMFIFAILFFGILTDAGTFKPLIKALLKFAGNNPSRVAVATALLAMAVHLDGSGAVTFLVTIPALLPLYDTLQMKRTTLATIAALAAGTMNILPWGGSTIRAATASEVNVTELFNPLLIPVIGGLLTVLIISYFLGKKERVVKSIQTDEATSVPEVDTGLERPRLYYFNIALVLLAVAILISGIAPPHIIFMVAFAISLIINYPNPKEQGERINAHAKAALLMASILFAAGCFTGILKGSGMINAMAESAVTYIPRCHR